MKYRPMQVKSSLVFSNWYNFTYNISVSLFESFNLSRVHSYYSAGFWTNKACASLVVLVVLDAIFSNLFPSSIFSWKNNDGTLAKNPECYLFLSSYFNLTFESEFLLHRRSSENYFIFSPFAKLEFFSHCFYVAEI